MMVSIHSDKAVAEIEKMGIAMYKVGADGTKAFRDVEEVIVDLMLTSDATDKNIEKMMLAASGGKFQYNKVASLLGDYNELIRVTELSINSQGVAANQTAMQLDTIASKVATIKAQLEGAIVGAGNSGLTKYIKHLIDDLGIFISKLESIPEPVWKNIGAITEMTMKAMALTVGLRVLASMGTTATGVVAGLSAMFNTAAMSGSRLAAVSTIATGGLNLLIPLILGGTAAYAMYNAESAESLKASKELNDAHELEGAKLKDKASVTEQEIDLLANRIKFVNTLATALPRLVQQLAQEGEATEKGIKTKEKLQTTYDALIKTLGNEAVERIKAAGNTKESIDKEIKAMEDKQEVLGTTLREERRAIIDHSEITINKARERLDAIKAETLGMATEAQKQIAIYDSINAAKLSKLKWEAERDDNELNWRSKQLTKVKDAAGGNETQDTIIEATAFKDAWDKALDSKEKYRQALEAEGAGESKKIKEALTDITASGNPYSPGSGMNGSSYKGTVDDKEDRGSSSTPKDTTASIEDKLELHTEKRKLAEVLHNAKKAKDAYDARIDDIKSYEEINGADTFSMLEYMDARKLMIKTMQTQNETLGYDIEGLEVLINAHIATNEELQGKLAGKDAKGNLIGYADMSKEQRRHQLAINSDLLSNDKNLSGYMSIKDSAENKVSENNKEISKLSNDNLVQNSQLKPEDVYRTKLERNKVSEEIALANATNKLDMNNEIALNKIKLDTMLANKKLYVDELRRLDDIVAEDIVALNAKENEGNKAAIEKQLQLHQDAADKQRAIVAKNANDIVDLEYAKNAKINEGMAGITSDILVQGNSLRQVWNSLWQGLANDAIKALFRVNNSTPSLLGSILGLFGGGSTATGGTSWGNTFGTSVSGGMFTFADGGISDKPAIFGEAGAEMAIPLTQGKRGRALELYAKTGALLGVNKGTDVVANVSPRTMEIAQQSSATAQMARINAEHLSRLDTQIGLMTQQNSMILTMLGQGGGQGGVVQPIVMSQSMDKGQLWSMIESMRRDGYKV